MIRVVMVNYGGGELTMRSLEHLLRTDWPPEELDVVLVDNPVGPVGTGGRSSPRRDDGVADEVARTMPRVRVLRSGVNLGFAGGNNAALHDLEGVDHVALVNNDVAVPPGWLKPLVAALEGEPALGAACPKILLADRFVEVEIEAPTHVPGRGDPRALGVRLGGARHPGTRSPLAVQHVSGFWGPQVDPGAGRRPRRGAAARAEHQWSTGRALLRLPEPQSLAVELRLGAPGAATGTDNETVPVTITSGDIVTHLDVGADDRWWPVAVSRDRVDVVNNAGSILIEGGFGADRGWLERDGGQYDAPVEVEAWCGAAVLLQADYLRDVGLFDERLFLYYEDLELSVRGARRGWRYRYEPASVVRHTHSATAIEGSPLSRYHNERNRLLVLARHEPAADVMRALGRYLLVTGSYARRDLAVPLLRGDRPSASVVGQRLRALGGFARLAPSMWRDRRPR